MQLIDPTTGRVVWDSADPYAGPVPPAPEGRQWQVVGGMTPKAPAPQASGLDYYLGGTGIPNKLAMLNQMFNPVEAMGQSMQAGRRMLSPGRGGWDRVADAGNMLSGVAGVVAPTYAAVRGGVPAANALAETMTGISMTPQANALAGFAADESGAMRLYHGSPHDFDRFSMDKIGTGEGAQAYGHGLYFADKEEVAKGYRANNSASAKMQYGGRPINDEVRQTVAWEIDYYGYDKAKVLEEWKTRYKPTFWEGTLGRKMLRELDRMDPAKIRAGNMYEVQINADPNDFLDWDKPLSEQPNVRQALSSVLGRSKVEMPDGVVQLPNGRWSPAVGGEAIGRPQGWPDKATAEQALKYMVEDDAPYLYGKAGDIIGRQSNQPQIAEALRNQGIPGIRYLDAGSRGAGDGSRNYVVFDENLITIVRKYGIAGAAAMLGVSVADVEQAMAQERQ